MSKVHKRGPTTPEMNMTPLIDVTFQLIIFFMLVNNIVSDQTVEMIVPELADPQTRELAEGNRIIVSIAPDVDAVADRRRMAEEGRDDYLAIRGEASAVYVGSDRYPKQLGGGFPLPQILAELQAAKAANPDIKVLLRADAGIHYSDVAQIMEVINSAEISEVEMVALKPDREPQIR